MQDVWDPQDPDARRLRTILKAWMDREREGASNDAAAALSDEDRARLQAMGYGGPIGR